MASCGGRGGIRGEDAAAEAPRVPRDYAGLTGWRIGAAASMAVPPCGDGGWQRRRPGFDNHGDRAFQPFQTRPETPPGKLTAQKSSKSAQDVSVAEGGPCTRSVRIGLPAVLLLGTEPVPRRRSHAHRAKVIVADYFCHDDVLRPVPAHGGS